MPVIVLNIMMYVNVWHAMISIWNCYCIFLCLWWLLKYETLISLVKFTLIHIRAWNTSLWPPNKSWNGQKLPHLSHHSRWCMALKLFTYWIWDPLSSYYYNKTFDESQSLKDRVERLEGLDKVKHLIVQHIETM